MKMLLKACPKCRIGDLLLEQDVYGWYVQCIQCGYTKDVAKDMDVGKAKATSSRELVKTPTRN